MTLSRPSAVEMAERIRKVGEDLLNIARDIAAALDENSGFLDDLVAEGIDRTLIFRLDRFGRGQIHRSLVFSTSKGAERAIRIPISEQSRVLKDGVPVLEPNGEGIRTIPLHELTAKQAKQAFALHALRTPAEQRTYLDICSAKGRTLDCGLGLTSTKEGVRLLPINILVTWELVRKMSELMKK